jgi:hypothetical protein
VFGKWKLLTPISNQQEFKSINKNFQNQLILELTFNSVLDIFNRFSEFLTSHFFLKFVAQNPKRMDKSTARGDLF